MKFKQFLSITLIFLFVPINLFSSQHECWPASQRQKRNPSKKSLKRFRQRQALEKKVEELEKL